MAANVSAKIRVEGAGAFKQSMRESALQVKNLDSELKLLDKQLKNGGDATKIMGEKAELLGKKFEASGEAIDKIRERMQQLKDAGVSESSEEYQRLVSQLNKYKIAQEDATGATDDAGDSFENLPRRIALTSKALDIAVDAAKKLGSAFINVVKGAISYNAEIESYEKTITAFFKTSGQGSREASNNAQKLIENQRMLSRVTGVATNSLIDANKMLIASGVAGERSQEAIAGLAKAIVATGGGSEELSRMAQNLQQIQNVGKASAMDMKQFAMAGVDVYGLIADQTGLTVEKLKEMDISFDMIVDALTSATSEGGKFFEASQVGAETLNGKFNILKTTWEEGIGTATESFNVALRDEILPAAIELVENVDWEALAGILAGMAKAAIDLSNALVTAGNYLIEEYGPKASTAIDANGKSFQQLAAEAVRAGGSVTFFADQTIAGTENAYSMWSAYQGNVTGIQSQIAGDSLTYSKEAMDNLHAGIDGFSRVKEAEGEFEAWMDKQWATIYDQAYQNGLTTDEEIASAIEDGTIHLNGAMKVVQQSVENPLKELNDNSGEWGYHYGLNWANGLDLSVPLVSGAANRVAAAAAGPLQHTVPKEGPLRNELEWGPHMMENIAKGMRRSTYLVEAEAQRLASIMASQISNAMVVSSAVVNSSPNYNSFTINQAPGQSPRALVREINRQLGAQYV